MQIESVFDPFMEPEIAPDPYEPSEGTIASRSTGDGKIVVEVFRRNDDTYGFRYRAWVAWRDAGSNVRQHSWRQVEPDENLITGDHRVARTIAEQHACQGASSSNKSGGPSSDKK